MAVKSMRSNGVNEEAILNDTFELWSLPWHDLQRSLAQRVGGEPVRPSRLRAQRAASPRAVAGLAGNWLSRARSLARLKVSPARH